MNTRQYEQASEKALDKNNPALMINLLNHPTVHFLISWIPKIKSGNKFHEETGYVEANEIYRYIHIIFIIYTFVNTIL